MDEAYFVPRSEILKWVNDLLKISLPKIEALGSGAVYCQILDAIKPEAIPISKVNFKAKLEYEFLSNYKILQSAFQKLNIKKVIDIEKLSKAKYQDNLELIQWMKKYFEISGGNKDYDALARRGDKEVVCFCSWGFQLFG